MEYGLEDREPAPEFNRAVRTCYPSPDDVLIASIIDLSIVPSVYWMTVGMVLNTAYSRPPKRAHRTWTRQSTTVTRS